MEERSYRHPKPTLNRLAHYIVALLLIPLWLTIPAQLVLTLLLPGGIMLVSALLTLLLSLPLLLFLFATPEVSLSEGGIEVRPVVGRAHLLPWKSVRAIKDYPLLPRPDQETERRALMGRRKYRAAAGKMLLVEGLPFQYRAAGFFSGEGWRPVIALTNRTHTDYEALIGQVTTQLDRIAT